jgi:hypothetical protein
VSRCKYLLNSALRPSTMSGIVPIQGLPRHPDESATGRQHTERTNRTRGGVELNRRIENTEIIENTRRTNRQRRRKSSSDVHGMYWSSHKEDRQIQFSAEFQMQPPSNVPRCLGSVQFAQSRQPVTLRSLAARGVSSYFSQERCSIKHTSHHFSP